MTEKEMQKLEQAYLHACCPEKDRVNNEVLNACLVVLDGKEPPEISEKNRDIFYREALPYCKAVLEQFYKGRAKNG